MQSAKDAVRQIIDHLPDQATWEEIMYELYVKQKIEAGRSEGGGRRPHHSPRRDEAATAR